MSRRVVTVAVAVAVALLVAASSAQAQYHGRMQSRPTEQSLSYVIGFAALDDGYVSDSLGRAWSVRMDSPIIGRFVMGELALSGVSTKDLVGTRQRFLIPEAQVQFQLPVGPFRPYLGFGAGGVMGPRGTGTILDGGQRTLSTAIGLRTYLAGDRLTLNIESRVRQYGERNSGVSSVDVTAGVGLRF